MSNKPVHYVEIERGIFMSRDDWSELSEQEQKDYEPHGAVGALWRKMEAVHKDAIARGIALDEYRSAMAEAMGLSL